MTKGGHGGRVRSVSPINRQNPEKLKRKRRSSRSMSPGLRKRKIKKELLSDGSDGDTKKKVKSKIKSSYQRIKEEDVRRRPHSDGSGDEKFSRDHKIKHEPDSDISNQRREREHYNKKRQEHHRRRREREDHHIANDIGARSHPLKEDVSEKEKEKDKANFELSGKLAEDTNTFRGQVIKYNEPPEARKPQRRWRLYPFKDDEPLPVLHIHRQSAYLLGRDRLVADIPIDHPSCSKQHAALQYRLVDFKRPDGSTGRRIRPYVIDLGSANGTFVNNQKIEAQRYVELFEKDVLKFAFSSREYVMLHDTSNTAEVDEALDSD